jgi:hypothetical protein
VDTTAAIRHRAIPVRQWAPHRHWLARIGLWVIVATLVLATVEATRNAGSGLPTDNPAAAEPANSVAATELPREWRWDLEAISFDHMYRQEKSPGQSDWVRAASQRVPGGGSDVGRSASRR